MFNGKVLALVAVLLTTNLNKCTFGIGYEFGWRRQRFWDATRNQGLMLYLPEPKIFI
jgi:hypothetical protein